MIHVKVWIDDRIMYDTVSRSYLRVLDCAKVRYEILDETRIIY